ncbi:unnamed protein product [Sympodiomycopsis kandeliae]
MKFSDTESSSLGTVKDSVETYQAATDEPEKAFRNDVLRDEYPLVESVGRHSVVHSESQIARHALTTLHSTLTQCLTCSQEIAHLQCEGVLNSP